MNFDKKYDDNVFSMMSDDEKDDFLSELMIDSPCDYNDSEWFNDDNNKLWEVIIFLDIRSYFDDYLDVNNDDIDEVIENVTDYIEERIESLQDVTDISDIEFIVKIDEEVLID